MAKKNEVKKAKVASSTTKAPREAKVKEIESRHLSELDNKDRAYLEELLRKNPAELTAGEQAHLKARACYLTVDERKKYL